MTDAVNIVQTIKSLFHILANSERDSQAVRDSLAELAKNPDFLSIFRDIMEELGDGIHIHVHENHYHSHFHNDRDYSTPTYPTYPTYPRITWEPSFEPITISDGNTSFANGGDGEDSNKVRVNIVDVMEEARKIINIR